MAKKKTSTGLEVNYVRTDEKKLKKTISMADVRKDEGKVRSIKWNNTQNTGTQGTSSPVPDNRTSRIDNMRDRYDAVKKRRAEIEKQFNGIDYGYENHDLSADGMAMSRAQVLEDALEKLTAEEERLKYLGAGYKETGNKFTDFLTQAKANYDLGRLGQDKAKAYAEYADNPTEEAETNARALSLLEQQFATQFDDVLDDNGAVLPWLSKSASGYIPQAIDQAKGTLKGAVIGGLVTAPSLNPFVIATGVKTGGAIGGGAAMYDVVRGSAIESMLNAGIDIETAKKAAQNEALLSSLIESAELGVDFTTFGAGKWLNIIGSYAQNIGTESLEEASQQGISIANLRRLQAGEDPSLLGLAKDTLGVYRDAITGEDIDARNEMLEAGKEGGKIAAVMGGANRVGGAVLNRAVFGDTAISEDNDPRAALLQTEEKQPVQVQQTASETENAEKGVLSDSGGISEEGVKLDSEEEIVAQRPQANSDDAVMEFARETVAKRQEHQQADREAIEYNVRQATGYGEQGVKAVADIVEKTNADTVEIDRAFRTAYETGLTGIERSKVELVNEIQEKAYTAGYLDYTAEMEKLKSTQVMVRKDGGVFPDDKKLYKNLPTQTYNSLNRIGKALGTAIVMDDTLTEQQQGYYNAKDGSIHISTNVENVSTNVENAVMEVFKHEVTHRMQELAPTEYAAFRSFVYESLNEDRMSSATLAEMKKAQYASMGVNEDISGSIDEVVAAFTEELFADEQKLHNFIAEVTGDETKRNWAQKFFDIIREVIDKVKGAIRKGDTSIADSIKQLEKAEQMWKDAMKASAEYVKNTQSNRAQKNTADGDVKYDLNGTDFQEDKYFARQIDKWDELKDGTRIKVGVVNETSALHKVGLPATGMYFDVGKIKKAMNEHGDHLSKTILKSIPDLLNEPIVIAEYTGAENTVNVYGNLFINGKPVVVGVVMQKDRTGQNVINKIRTIHMRNDATKQITDETVLYLNEDKKKTAKWFQVCGNLNVPLEGTRFGVIRIISFKEENVKYSLKDSSDRELTKEQQEFYADSKILDKDGNLLVLYHGTGADFTVFDTKRAGQNYGEWSEYGKGIYLTPSTQLAKYYAENARGSKTKTMELYANIENPFNVTKAVEFDIDDLAEKYGLTEFDVSFLKRAGYRLTDFLRDHNEDITAYLTSKGHDGLWDMERGKATQVVAYKENQVKNVDNKNPTSNSDIRFSLKEDKDILKENAKLKEINAALKNQFKVTKFAKVDKKALERFAKQLLKDYSSQADAGETRLMLDGLYQYMASGENGESAVWEDVYKQAREIAEDVLRKSVEVDDEMYREYADLRKYLRETPISISPEDVADIDGIESLQEFRKKYWGRIRISNDGIRIDDIYGGLSAEYPALFDAETETHPGAQLARIGQVLDEMRPVEYNPYSSNIGQTADYMAYDIVDRFFELPQAKPTFADKVNRKLTETKIREGKKLENLRTQKNERIAQLIAEGRQKVKETQQKEREKRVQAVDELKDKQKQREKKMSEKRQAAILRKRIEKHTKALSDKLLKPTDKRHIPEALRKTVAALLESINLESQYTIGEDGKRHKSSEGAPVKRSQLFNKLQEEYAKISENGEMVVDPALIGGEGVQSLFTQAMAMGNTKIADMTAAELDVLWQVIRAVEHSISTANKVLSNAKYQATSEWANDILAESGTRRAMKGKGMEKLRIDLENPYTFFSHYGESGKAIFRMLRDAQDKQQIMTNYIAEEVAKVVDDKTVKKLEKDTHEFKTERGDKLTLTTAHVMEVYLLSKREQAQGHLLEGGIVQPAIESKKIKRGTDSILLSFDDLQNIIGKLTQEQRDIADALQKLTGTTLAEYGNEASMKAYGYKKFTGENYWTIKSAKEGIHSNIEKGAGNSRSIKNIGLAKNVMPHASNPLDINGIFKTFASHSADMIDYAAWLCPMEDANRLYNFSFRDEMGNQTGKTMKGLLDRVGGIGAQEYWHNLMEDIQNGIKTKEDTAWYGHIGDKLLSNAKSAAVGANIRVIIQQPTAIMRAAMVLSPADMVQGTLTGGGWKTALKYSAIAQRKDAGGFDISSPMGMYETLFDGRTAGRKFNDAMMWGAGKADAITWGRIWNACEHNVKNNQPELQTGSKEFYKAVDALFTEVIDQSQVVDGILQRSQLMRASDTWKKYLTSFMGEPTMALNMCIRSYNAWRNQTDKEKRNAALKKLSRSITVLVITNAFNALAQSFVDAWRDDDEDKGYWSRWYTAFFGITGEEDSTGKKALSVIFQGNLASNINPLNNVPLAKDVVSIMAGYDVTRMDADVMSDVLNSGKKFFDSMSADGKYTKPYGIKEFALNLSKACGISALNILRDVWGVARSYAVATDDVMMQYQMEKAILKVGNEKNNSAFVNILYRAYNTDQEMYQAIYDDMVSNGIDADKIATGMESRMKKAQGVKKVSELEERYLSPTQEKEYKQKNKIISNTNLWKSATDGAKNKIEDYLYDIVMDKDSDFVKKVEAAAEVDIDDTEYLLYKLALEMYDKPTENGKYGTFTQEEAENAILELDGLTDAQRAYLWQNTNKGWNEKKNPWK